MNIKDIRISSDGSHHIINGEPMYEKRFRSVMSFHEPGFAPVEDESGAYHIETDGSQMYQERFWKTFGFYCGLAAVSDATGWFHITPEGKPAYDVRYDWVGNFQENLCAVRSKDGYYHHIKLDGSNAYDERHRYVGDFKYGIAVVYNDEGMAYHIDVNGKPVNGKKFLELGVFHKGFAIARDGGGFYHINRNGDPIYSDRFEWVEPFYNSQAFVKNKMGEICVINEKGETVHLMTPPESLGLLTRYRHELMDTMVGYWNTQILYCIVRSGILDALGSGVKEIVDLSEKLNLPERSIEMLIDACVIWNLINISDRTITPKGSMLLNEGPLNNAARMWGEEHYKVMERLWDSLKTQEQQFEKLYNMPLFDYFLKKENDYYYKAMEEYSQDYKELVEKLPLEDVISIVDVGGGTGELLRQIIEQFPDIKEAYLFDLPGVDRNGKKEHAIEIITGDFFKDTLPKADSAVLSRILHDWPDHKCKIILDSVNISLPMKGRIIIIETVMPDDIDRDVGVRLNFNLLVSVGGRERKRNEFLNLLNLSGFENVEIIETNSIVSIICARKERDVS